MKKGFSVLAAVLALTALLAGCGIKEADVPYADDMAQNMMQGLKQNDYAMFSRDLSDTMKGAIDADAFAAMVDQLSATIGTYESMSFYQASNTKQNDVAYTSVIYKAKFSDEEGDVLVTVTFSGEEGSKVIDGLFFTSPKLREAAASAAA